MWAMDSSTEEKFSRVADSLSGKSVLVAFSGGVDSSVLAHVAAGAASRAALLTVSSQVVPADEVQRARSISSEIGAEHIIVEFDWLADENLIKNPRHRCYSCKRHLAEIWKSKAKELGLDLVVEGTTATEEMGYRPGLEALKEAGVASPFIEASISKEEIRAYAKEKGISVADAPSNACLATRFPYGETITQDLLSSIESIEDKVRALFNVECVRARYHGDLVRIEVEREKIPTAFDPDKMKELDSFVKGKGFSYATLDLAGYRTGSMDET